jgi:hypothetical protein
VAGAALLEIVDIVPTFLVEAVRHHRSAQQVSDLAAGHAFLDGVHGGLIQEVTLLDVDAVNAAGDRDTRGARQQRGLNNFDQSGLQPLNER